MFFTASQINKNDNITLKYEEVDLIDFLNILGDKYNFNFFVTLKIPIKLKNINFHNQKIELILNHICNSFDLDYKIEGRNIFIKSIDKFWNSYVVQFFCEDHLNNLSSFFTHKITDRNSEKLSFFWLEIEKNIKELTKNNYSIDKYSGIINVLGDKSTHDKVKKYLDKVLNNLYSQVSIECKVVEISTEINQTIDLQPILLSIQGSLEVASITACVAQFIKECQKLYSHISISKSEDIQIKLMSQQTGQVISSKIDYYQENERTILDRQTKLLTRSQENISIKYSKNEHGFCLSVVPLILDNKTVLLKLRPSLSMPQKDGPKNPQEPQNIQRREFNTVIKTISGQNYILGGLYLEYDFYENDEVTDIPILNYFFNKKRVIKKKSYFVLFIKVTIC